MLCVPVHPTCTGCHLRPIWCRVNIYDQDESSFPTHPTLSYLFTPGGQFNPSPTPMLGVYADNMHGFHAL